jgi:hypothetical protein
MSNPSNESQETPKSAEIKPTIRNHEDCQHAGAYRDGRGEEERRYYNRDNPSGEYDVEWVIVEYWNCPNCGAAWDEEVG